MTKTTITMDELFREIAELSKNQNGDRPKGYFTIDEAARELFLSGRSSSMNAAQKRVSRILLDLDVLGRLETIQVMTQTGISKQRHRASAFKILPEKRTLRKR